MKLLNIASMFVTSIFLIGQMADGVLGVCCDCPAFSTHCADGAKCTPCCGVKGCDIFCCSCDGGCRGGDNGLAEKAPSRITAQRPVFTGGECLNKAQAVDINNDGIITFLEWAQSKEVLRDMPWEKLAAQWEIYDIEGKGYLTIEEAFLRRS